MRVTYFLGQFTMERTPVLALQQSQANEENTTYRATSIRAIKKKKCVITIMVPRDCKKSTLKNHTGPPRNYFYLELLVNIILDRQFRPANNREKPGMTATKKTIS